MSTLFASRFSARFVKSVSVFAVAAALSGCASDTVRFSDGFYTGAVPKQQAGAVQTPFPNNAPQQTYQQPNHQNQANSANGSNIDYTHTSAVPKNSTVQRQQLTAPTTQTAVVAPASTNLETIKPKKPEKPAVLASTATKAIVEPGWSAVGGSVVTLKANENLSVLGKRYGVPASEIAKANGLNKSAVIAAGTKLIIPVYNSKTSKSSTTTVVAPIPSNRPANTQVASLAPSIAAATKPAIAEDIAKSGKYIVASGDTLSRIAAKTGVSVASIKRLNGLSSDNLKIGQSLLIPGLAGNPTQAKLANTATKIDPVTTGNTEKPKEVASYTPPKAKIETKGSIATIDSSSTASAPAKTGVGNMRWPAQGRVISAFGSNIGGKGNNGIDISVPKGTAIKSAENGVVIYAGDGLKEFGKTVLVRHGNGLVTVYGHLNEISVSRGDTVSRGQSVGTSGMTGSAKQPQLHFEVRKNTSPVDPMTYLR